MNAVSMFREILKNPEKVENIDLKGFMSTRVINIKLKNLTEQEEQELSHLRISNVNGAIFDDREYKYE